jgi:hypothetical protein
MDKDAMRNTYHLNKSLPTPFWVVGQFALWSLEDVVRIVDDWETAERAEAAWPSSNPT